MESREAKRQRMDDTEQWTGELSTVATEEVGTEQKLLETPRNGMLITRQLSQTLRKDAHCANE